MQSFLKSIGPLSFDRAYASPVSDRSNTWFFRQQWTLYRLSLILGDVLFVGLALLAAYGIRFFIPLPIFRTEVLPSYPFYQGISYAMTALYVTIFAFNGLYSRRNLLGGTNEYSLVFRAVGTSILLIIIAGFLTPSFALARGWLFLAWGFGFLFVALHRFVQRRIVYGLRKQGYFLSKAIIVGANDEALSLAEQLLSWQTSGLNVVGFVDDTVETSYLLANGLQVFGGNKDIEKQITSHGVEELIISTSALTREQMLDVFERFGMREDVNLRLSSGLFEIITTGIEISEMGNVPLFRINKVRLTGADRVMKGLLDYIVALLLLPVLLPILGLIALLVKFDSRGPIIHRRRVMGVNGTQYDAFKFRSMAVNGDEILAQYPALVEELRRTHKLKNDPRITRIGRVLRKTSLDELPQLFNVLLGQMSLVGPRMISPGEVEMYKKWSTNLLTVKPGITGLWQVSGRSDIEYTQRVQLDMHYVRNWTIWLDLQILFQTLPAVLRGHGSY